MPDHSRRDPVEDAVAQWHAHGWEGGERLRAALSVIRVEELIRETSTEVLRPLDLSYARHELLSLLYFTSRGELPLGKLSARLMVHPASVTTTVDSLEKLGLVERAAHPTDRRTTLARITKAGRERVEASTPQLVESRFGLGSLSEEEAGTLAALLRKVREGRGDF
jgi:DNA-binding MarR family transcriptional regulator